MSIDIQFPYQVNIFHVPPDKEAEAAINEILDWCDEVLPNRHYRLAGGDHDYDCATINLSGVDLFDTWVEHIVFRDAEAMMLFKLTWCGVQ